MKKNNIKVLILALVVAFTTSCSENLEEIAPQQSVAGSEAFASASAARGSTVGLYGLSQDLEVLGSMPQIIADYQADNVNFIGSFPTLQEVNNYSTLANNGSIDQIWEDNYEVILAANAVVVNVPNVADEAGFDDTDRAQLVAEAKFIRAVVYFNLVNLFAQPFQIEGGTNDGVPLVLEPFDPLADIVLPARSSVNAVHDQIEADLLDAIADLPGEALAGSGRATVSAARVLLSRLYLYREEYADAATQAALITSAPTTYAPANNLDYWSAGGSEFLFALVNTAIDNGETGSGGWNSYYEPAEQNGRGDCPFSADLLAAYTAGDERLAFSEVGANGGTYTLKWDDAATDEGYAPVVRVAEAYLNHAEALANTSTTVTAEMVDLLNMTRTRAGLTAFATTDFADVDAFLDAVLLERRLEFAFEGHRRMDLLRNDQALRPSTDVNFAASAPGQPLTVLPIPQRERDLNGNLSQNTGY